VQLDTLIRMGQQIAVNNAALPHDRAVARIAGHLTSFWTPAMIAEIRAFAAAHPSDLDPLLADALSALGD
jgi:formate dehydrogenase subunit delta